jgi:hypothetical protein
VIGAAAGREQVRVERLHGELRVAPEGELADKGGRYCVRKVLALQCRWVLSILSP